jgi:hypothetical protein
MHNLSQPGDDSWLGEGAGCARCAPSYCHFLGIDDKAPDIAGGQLLLKSPKISAVSTNPNTKTIHHGIFL